MKIGKHWYKIGHRYRKEKESRANKAYKIGKWIKISNLFGSNLSDSKTDRIKSTVIRFDSNNLHISSTGILSVFVRIQYDAISISICPQFCISNWYRLSSDHLSTTDASRFKCFYLVYFRKCRRFRLCLKKHICPAVLNDPSVCPYALRATWRRRRCRHPVFRCASQFFVGIASHFCFYVFWLCVLLL